jgi:ABC-type transport system involved in cytochrome c biogenesis permease subunit
MILILNAATAVLYFFSALGHFFYLIFSARRVGRIAVGLFLVGALLHTGLLAAHILEQPYPFFLRDGDFFYLAAWVSAVVYFLALRKYRLIGLSAVFSLTVLALFLLAEIRRRDFSFGAGVAENPWAPVHILLMSLAFAVFTTSFLIGLVYLLQQAQLKGRHPGTLLSRLPPLETTDHMHYRALTVGFVLLSAGILAGAALSKTTGGRFFSGDPRQVMALVTWVLYALFLNVRLKAGWRGRRGILLSILGFVGVVLAFLALEHRVM